MSDRDVTGLGLRFGTSEEGRSWCGRVWERRYAALAVNRAMILDFCALVEDANPAYWNGDEAPWGLLMTWSMPLPWHPTAKRRPTLAALEVPLPGHHIINVSTDTRFERKVRVGEMVSWVDELLDVSEPKRTRLGEGHFITTRTTYAGDGEQPVAINTNVIFRYDVTADSHSGAGATHTAAGSDALLPDLAAGDDLPPVTLDIDYRRVVHNAAATWDWFPGHHNPDYARSQGQRTIYLSTLFYHGLIDRAVTEWLGQDAVISRREMRMQRSIYAGQTATVCARRSSEGATATLSGNVVGDDGPAVSFTVDACKALAVANIVP